MPSPFARRRLPSNTSAAAACSHRAIHLNFLLLITRHRKRKRLPLASIAHQRRTRSWTAVPCDGSGDSACGVVVGDAPSCAVADTEWEWRQRAIVPTGAVVVVDAASAAAGVDGRRIRGRIDGAISAALATAKRWPPNCRRRVVRPPKRQQCRDDEQPFLYCGQ